MAIKARRKKQGKIKPADQRLLAKARREEQARQLATPILPTPPALEGLKATALVESYEVRAQVEAWSLAGKMLDAMQHALARCGLRITAIATMEVPVERGAS